MFLLLADVHRQLWGQRQAGQQQAVQQQSKQQQQQGTAGVQQEECPEARKVRVGRWAAGWM